MMVFSKVFTATGTKFQSLYTPATLLRLRDVKEYVTLKGEWEFAISEPKGRTRYVFDHGEWRKMG